MEASRWHSLWPQSDAEVDGAEVVMTVPLGVEPEFRALRPPLVIPAPRDGWWWRPQIKFSVGGGFKA